MREKEERFQTMPKSPEPVNYTDHVYIDTDENLEYQSKGYEPSKDTEESKAITGSFT